ncbi:hypothetical protein MMC10_004478 [Thelotrema lepadinum]|nr:hypothetical protein [Thelotrema lepadinum]
MPQGGSIALGILVGLVSTSVQSLGLTLQRKSHILEDEKEFQDSRRPPYKRRRWQLGMSMFIISNIVGSTIQITTLPLPVLSTLQASGLVFNSICATLILGEPFTRYSLAGTILVAGGAALIASFGAIAEPAHSLDQLLVLLGRWQFVLWIVGTAVAVVAILVASRALKLLSGQNSNSPRMRLARGMAYGGVSGILSAHSLLVAKSAVELLVRTIVAGDNQFNRVPSWLILLGLVALALSQLYFLHRGLKLCSTSVLYPFVFCVYNIIAILDGLIYFHQASRLTILDALMITLGTIILLTGVVCLSWRLNSDPSTNPAVTQTPLTPGMGFVPTDSDSDDEEDALLSPAYEQEEHDEDETALLHPPRRSLTLPAKLASSSSQSQSQQPSYGTTSTPSAIRPKHIRLPSPSPSPSPSSKRTSPSSLLKLSRSRRARTAVADEIWGELEEDTPAPSLSPLSTRRRSSWGTARAMTPSRLRPSSQSSSGAAAAVVEEEGEEGGLQADERTGLLARSSSGRNYRDRRWRRRSVPSTSAITEDPPSGSGNEEARRKGHSRSKSQDAVGGWWRMKKWWKITGDQSKRKGKRRESEEDRRGDEGRGESSAAPEDV